MGLAVREGIEIKNVLSISMIALTGVMLGTFLNAQLVFLLSNPAYFNIPANQMGYSAGLLNMVGYPGAILGSIFIGYAFDIFGRRLTIAFSLYASSILIAIVPWTSPNIFPWLVVIRITIQLFQCAQVTHPLSVDYIEGDSIGRGYLLTGLGVILGEMICLGVLFKITIEFDPTISFAIAGVSGIVFTTFLMFMIKEPDGKIKKRVVKKGEVADYDQFDQEITERTTDSQKAVKEENKTDNTFENFTVSEKVIYLANLLYTSCKNDSAIVVCLLC